MCLWSLLNARFQSCYVVDPYEASGECRALADPSCAAIRV